MFLQKKIRESVASFKGLRAFFFGNWKDSSLMKPFPFDAMFTFQKLPSILSATIKTRGFRSKFWKPGLWPGSYAAVH